MVYAMETPQLKDSVNHVTITGECNKRTKTLENGNGNSVSIPIDLIFEILSRLPAKSIARCRCLSKLWTSILRRPDFTELFLTRACARPRLLFTCLKDSELFFSTTPQLDSRDRNSRPLIASYHMSFPFHNGRSYFLPSPVNGLICLWIFKGKREMVPLICNPSTGQSLPLPKVKTSKLAMNCYLGYDPIGKQYKVLSMTYVSRGTSRVFKEHQVLTLGTQKPSWRMVECCIPFYSFHDGLCINGVLYYKASTNGSANYSMIVCFDVRSEKFRFIKVVEALYYRVMVNYNGKLGLLTSNEMASVDKTSKSIELWILEDFKKQEWSKHVLVLPASWKAIIGDPGSGLTGFTSLQFAGVTQTNEIVLSPTFFDFCMPYYYVLYYNIERNTITRLQVQGMSAYKGRGVCAYVNHVEDLKLM